MLLAKPIGATLAAGLSGCIRWLFCGISIRWLQTGVKEYTARIEYLKSTTAPPHQLPLDATSVPRPYLFDIIDHNVDRRVLVEPPKPLGASKSPFGGKRREATAILKESAVVRATCSLSRTGLSLLRMPTLAGAHNWHVIIHNTTHSPDDVLPLSMQGDAVKGFDTSGSFA